MEARPATRPRRPPAPLWLLQSRQEAHRTCTGPTQLLIMLQHQLQLLIRSGLLLHHRLLRSGLQRRHGLATATQRRRQRQLHGTLLTQDINSSGRPCSNNSGMPQMRSSSSTNTSNSGVQLHSSSSSSSSARLQRTVAAPAAAARHPAQLAARQSGGVQANCTQSAAPLTAARRCHATPAAACSTPQCLDASEMVPVPLHILQSM